MKKYGIVFFMLLMFIDLAHAKNTSCENIDINSSVDLEQAIKVCHNEIEINSNDAEKLCKLGTLYNQKKEYKTALTWLKKSYALGHSKATHLLANMIYLGHGTEKNEKLALRFYLKAYRPDQKIIPCVEIDSSSNAKQKRHFNFDNPAVELAFDVLTNRSYCVLYEVGAICYKSTDIGKFMQTKIKNNQMIDLLKELADKEKNNVDASIHLGYAYMNGKYGAEKDRKTAFKWFTKAAERKDNYGTLQAVKLCLGKVTLHDNERSKSSLSDLIKNSKGIDSKEKCHVLYEQINKMAEKGNSEAQYVKGLYYYQGGNEEIDMSKALQWFDKSMKQGYTDAIFMIGKVYNILQFGDKNKEQNRAEMLKYFKEYASKGENNSFCAYYELGNFYHRFERDAQEAIKWFKKGANTGHIQSMIQLAEVYRYKGYGSLDEMRKLTEEQEDANTKEAIKWYIKASNAGAYYSEVDVAKLYQNLALKSKYQRQYAKANAYYKKTLEWAEIGAYKGLQESESITAWTYYEGKGVPVNYKEALYWFKKNSRHGRSSSLEQFEVGKMYFEGKGTRKDYIHAYAWINFALTNLSFKSDQESARKILNYLESKLTKEQLIYAQNFDPTKDTANKTKKGIKQSQGTTGTGFFVNNSYLLTNNHVAGNCKKIELKNEKYKSEAIVVVQDATNDLAVLKAVKKNNSFLMFKSGRGLRIGNEIVVLGYPLGILLGSGVKLTSGNVSGLTGLVNDATKLQLTAPVQPGNSGGPLLDRDGNVVGVIVARVEKGLSGRIAQNVNLAIKSNIAQMFLDTNNIDYDVKRSKEKKELADIADDAKNGVVQVVCYQ